MTEREGARKIKKILSEVFSDRSVSQSVTHARLTFIKEVVDDEVDSMLDCLDPYEGD